MSLVLCWLLRVASSARSPRLAWRLWFALAISVLRRLDGFQARCLRIILNIPPSYISRISNAIVLQRAGAESASDQLRKRQLLQLGKISRSPPDSALRGASFILGTDFPATDRYVRWIGRPCQECIRMVMPEAMRLTSSSLRLSHLVSEKRAWKTLVYSNIA